MNDSTALVATIDPPSKDDLLAAMAKGPCTNGWDIVTSYSVEALDEVLAASYQAGKIVADVSFSTDREDPITGKPFTVAYQLTLGAPNVRFLAGQAGAAVVTMPIQKGTYSITADGKVERQGELPTDHNVVAHVPLAAVTGDGKVSNAGDVIVFEGDESSHIVLHFKTGEGTGSEFSLEPPPDPKMHDILDTYLLPLLQQYFAEHVSAIDYAMASVAAVAPGPRKVVLEPKSFVFASDSGVLSLYILTTNSGGSEGNPHPAFQPGGVEMLPIPSGFTSSLILSKPLVQKVYLEPALTAAGRVELDETKPDGIRLRWFRDAKKLSYNPSHRGTSQLSIDTLTVDWTKLPFALGFADQQLSTSWSFDQRLSWRTDDVDIATGDDLVETGHTSVHVALSHTTPLTLSEGDELEVSLSIQAKDYVIDVKGKTGWFSSGPVITDTLKTFIDGHAAVALTFDFGSLSYFTVANLIFPGGEHFTVDTKAGFNTPHDAVLFGNVEK